MLGCAVFGDRSRASAALGLRAIARLQRGLMFVEFDMDKREPVNAVLHIGRGSVQAVSGAGAVPELADPFANRLPVP